MIFGIIYPLILLNSTYKNSQEYLSNKKFSSNGGSGGNGGMLSKHRQLKLMSTLNGPDVGGGSKSSLFSTSNSQMSNSDDNKRLLFMLNSNKLPYLRIGKRTSAYLDHDKYPSSTNDVDQESLILTSKDLDDSRPDPVDDDRVQNTRLQLDNELYLMKYFKNLNNYGHNNNERPTELSISYNHKLKPLIEQDLLNLYGTNNHKKLKRNANRMLLYVLQSMKKHQRANDVDRYDNTQSSLEDESDEQNANNSPAFSSQ